MGVYPESSLCSTIQYLDCKVAGHLNRHVLSATSLRSRRELGSRTVVQVGSAEHGENPFSAMNQLLFRARMYDTVRSIREVSYS